ncbi:response regulator transcription factor [Amycolatopsis sp. NPDC004169]|uniref:response regulator transcription factor n=1 Tax=Amycolatopsis sp. NPDC004169 TaxID=3154453 RepID=UPI0033ACF489
MVATFALPRTADGLPRHRRRPVGRRAPQAACRCRPAPAAANPWSREPAMIRTVLVDGRSPAKALARALLAEGISLCCVSSADHAFDVLLADRVDVVLVDFGLPGADGLTVCRAVRRRSEAPIVVILHRPTVADATAALAAGADQCVVEPLAARDFAARIQGSLRRRTITAEPATVRLGELEIRLAERQVRRSGREVRLTDTEFRLLAELAAVAPVAVSRSELLRRVWGLSRSADTRLLDLHVCRLRNKIEADPRRPRLLRTVRGVGYQAVPAW